MIRAVLFDLDGTLFDRATTVERCIRAQYGRCRELLGLVPEADYLSRFVELDAHGYVRKEIVYGQLADEYSLAPGAADHLFADFYATYHQHAVGFQDLTPTLDRLRSRGYALGLITNGRGSHQRATISALEIGDYFDVILISELEGLRKPDVRIFRKAIEGLGVPPREAVFVGDHPVVDVEGARAAGLWSIWRRDTHWGDCPTADATIDDLSSLLDLLSTGRLESAKPIVTGA